MSGCETIRGRRPRHAWLYALPAGELPARVACAGLEYELVEAFKHDFFAATGLYKGAEGLAVLKLGRASDLWLLPTRWIGRFLGDREAWMYQRLEDLPGVPRFLGRVGRNGLMHAFVPGHPLGRDERVSDAFFDQLAALLSAIHARNVAYVDLNKRQNILVGDDGRPYLIDFQISLFMPVGGSPLGRLGRWLLRRFQQADWYHTLKHKRRLRPDLLTDAERARVERLSFWIRLHRALAGPFTRTRRRVLKRLAASEDVAVAGSSAK